MNTKLNTAKILVQVMFVIIATTPFITVRAQNGGTQCPPGSSGSTCGTTEVSGSIVNPFKAGIGSSLPELFNSIIHNIIVPIGALVAVICFIWAGFMFVTAQGDEKKIATARTALLYTAIGTAILLGAEAITIILKNTITSLQTP